MTNLRPWKAWTGDPRDGACIVLARDHREAKMLAWPAIQGWYHGAEYIDLRVRLLPDVAMHHADPAKLEADEPHVIESPESCESCEMWHAEPLVDGLCEGCWIDWMEEADHA